MTEENCVDCATALDRLVAAKDTRTRGAGQRKRNEAEMSGQRARSFLQWIINERARFADCLTKGGTGTCPKCE